MTCVVGLVGHDGVWLGGDHAGTCGGELHRRRDPKVFRRGEWLFGFTTSYRMGQLIRYDLTLPDLVEQDPFATVVKRLVPAVQNCLKRRGWTMIRDHREEGFLVGYRGRLFHVASDFQVGESRNGYDAIGSGRSYALGVLYHWCIVHGWIRLKDPESVVTEALLAASHHSTSVAAPFTVLGLAEATP